MFVWVPHGAYEHGILYKSRNIPSIVFTEKRARVHLRVFTDTLKILKKSIRLLCYGLLLKNKT